MRCIFKYKKLNGGENFENYPLFCIIDNSLVISKEMKAKYRILLSNAIPGLIWMVVIIGGYTLFRLFFSDLNEALWNSPYIKPWAVYLAYSLSELFFGIFPPEFFLIWSFNHTSDIFNYGFKVFQFASISYLAGYLAFLIGQNLHKSHFLKKNIERYLKKYLPNIRRFGLFIIIIASLTPLPFSGMSLLVGISQFSKKKYLAYALFRFIRFAITGWVVFQSHAI